jgi:hypothetical protein
LNCCKIAESTGLDSEISWNGDGMISGEQLLAGSDPARASSSGPPGLSDTLGERSTFTVSRVEENRDVDMSWAVAWISS